MMAEYTPLEQWLYDTGIAMPGAVRQVARQIESSDWLAAHDAEVRAGVVTASDRPKEWTLKPSRDGGYELAWTDDLYRTHGWWISADEALALAAGVVAEEPEWETERVEEARIHYRYGVNSGTLAAWNTRESIALAIEHHERRTMGRIGVEKIETRTKITRTSPWVPVKKEGAEQ